MNPQLASLKDAYDILTNEERTQLIKELQIQMDKFLFRAKEKQELINYLKGDKK